MDGSGSGREKGKSRLFPSGFFRVSKQRFFISKRLSDILQNAIKKLNADRTDRTDLHGSDTYYKSVVIRLIRVICVLFLLPTRKARF